MIPFVAHIDRWLDERRPAGGGVQDLAYWQDRVLDVAMLFGVVVGSISLVPGALRAVLEEEWLLLWANVVVLAVASVVLLVRRVPYSIRAGVLVILSFGIGLVQLHVSGLHSPASLWLMAGPIIAAILFDLRRALSLLGLLIIILLGDILLAERGVLDPVVAAGVGTPRWIETATDMVLIAGVMSLFIGVLLRGLRISFEQVQRAEGERGRLAMAIEQAADAIAIVDPTAGVRYVNGAFERLFDRTRESSTGKLLRELALFEGADEELAEAEAALARGEVWSGRLMARRGATRWTAQASLSLLLGDSAGVPHHLAVIRDVSREVELESQLRQSQKMEAIGTFAGGIAHDFNNLLVPVLGTAELLRADAAGETAQGLDDIVESARRGRDLVAQILAFSRGGETRREALRLAEVLEESDRLLRASLPARIELEYAVDDPGPVLLSRSEVQQVLMNLCTNAFHAMRHGGGRLRIGLDTVRGDALDLDGGISTGAPDPSARYVRLSVTDSGEGMSRETLARVFEPFFTTKESGEGTGLGLAMVHGVVRTAGGVLAARTREGEGTTMEVLLPRLNGGGGRPAPAPERAPAGRGQRVLVVDDEAPVRKVSGRVLEKLGYRPVLAEDGPAALEVLRGPAEVDLLITDLSMPGMDGLELGAAALSLRPELPMVLCSGLIDRDAIRRAEAVGFRRMLPKPYDRNGLARAVHDALQQEVAAEV